MDLIEILDLFELDEKKGEIEAAEAKVADKEQTLAHLQQQMREDLKKEHQARSCGDTKMAGRFATLAERRQKSLRREKEALRELKNHRDTVRDRIREFLRGPVREVLGQEAGS